MTIGDRIKYLRTEKGIAQIDLAMRVGVSKQTLYKYENNIITNIPSDKIESISLCLGVSPAYLMGWEDETVNCRPIPANAIPYTPSHKVPILGYIPAGYPVLAVEDIEGYADIPYSDVENYFFLRVDGESMKNAGIHTGDLVLIRRQKCADDGQIVAARVNGDEATLKRYKCQGSSILLLPENPDFEPRIVPARDFEIGDAEIIGVALEVRHSL